MIRNTSSFFSINRVNSNSQKQPECIFVCSKHLISWLFWTPLLSKIVIIWLHRRQEESLRRHTWHIKESSQKFEIFRISFFPMKFHNRKSRWHIFFINFESILTTRYWLLANWNCLMSWVSSACVRKFIAHIFTFSDFMVMKYFLFSFQFLFLLFHFSVGTIPPHP